MPSGTGKTHLEQLLGAACDEFALGRSPATQRTVQNLRSTPINIADTPRTPIHDNDAACSPPDAIRRLVDDDPQSPCLAAVANVYRDLEWFESSKSHTPYAEIIGPTSLIRNLECRFGLFLLYPDITYSDHQHAADEVYFVLAGTGEWSLSRGPYRTRRPGAIIDIPSMTVHAMRTAQEPTLMLFSWTGKDISFDSYRFC